MDKMGKIYSTSLERKTEVDDPGLGKISIGLCTPEHTVLFPMAFESFRRRVESSISMIWEHWRPIVMCHPFMYFMKCARSKRKPPPFQKKKKGGIYPWWRQRLDLSYKLYDQRKGLKMRGGRFVIAKKMVLFATRTVCPSWGEMTGPGSTWLMEHMGCRVLRANQYGAEPDRRPSKRTRQWFLCRYKWGFLNLGSIDIWGQIALCCAERSWILSDVRSIPGFCPLDASRTLPIATPTSWDHQNCLQK